MFGVPYVYTQSRILKVRNVRFYMNSFDFWLINHKERCFVQHVFLGDRKQKSWRHEKTHKSELDFLWSLSEFKILVQLFRNVTFFQSGLCVRLVWSTFGITFRSERMTSWLLMPCATLPSVWAEPSEARQTMDSWSLQTRWVIILASLSQACRRTEHCANV